MSMTTNDPPSSAVEFVLGPSTRDAGITLSDEVVKLVARSPVYVSEAATLPEIARIMSEESIGVVLVSGPNEPAGIVSERDLVAALGESPDARALRASDVMSADIARVQLTDTISDAARRMLEDNIRHLAVTRGDVVVGVVSMRDVLTIYSNGETSS